MGRGQQNDRVDFYGSEVLEDKERLWVLWGEFTGSLFESPVESL